MSTPYGPGPAAPGTPVTPVTSGTPGYPAVPTPVPLAPSQVQTRSPYANGTYSPQTVPAGIPAGPPVVVPAQATASAPVSALPPYAQSYSPYGIPDEDRKKEAYGSTYVPVDSWVYPAMLRLYSLGYADTMFLSMRPYTRRALLHILEASEDDIRDGDNEEAQEIYTAVLHEVQEEQTDGVTPRGLIYGAKSVYERAMGISGLTLRDSYHLGTTINNDYGRPYEHGFNNLTGFSSVTEYGRFSLDIRGEYQHSGSAVGYSPALTQTISLLDSVIYTGYNAHQGQLIPAGPIAAVNPFRLQEATLSFFVAGHEISGGKSDAWLGPSQGGALAWSNNAENIYSFRINRVEPLHIPFVSALLGPIRYDFFYGSLKGHTEPENDYVHSEMIEFSPTSNFQFGFQRTVIFGGEGHEPVTLHTFLKGFFDVNDTTIDEKYSRNDPGARYSDFNFSWRLPFVRKHATLYTDSIAHDDVTPPSAPRRAAYRVGIFLSQVPKVPRLDVRIEAVNTDPPVLRSLGGVFNYYETIQNQAYTNKGFIMGDWIGREAKGGQAWLTYHLSGNEFLQFEYLNKKNTKDFIRADTQDVFGPYQLAGTTQNQYKFEVMKRFHHDDVELDAWFQYEGWKAPIYQPGIQRNTVTAVQVTFFPGLKKKTGPLF